LNIIIIIIVIIIIIIPSLGSAVKEEFIEALI